MQINLANTLLFRGMEPSDIDEMLGCLLAKERTYKKGEIIFPEGSPTAVSYTHLSREPAVAEKDGGVSQRRHPQADAMKNVV